MPPVLLTQSRIQLVYLSYLCEINLHLTLSLFIVFQQIMSSEQQARDLINQAQKKLNSWSFFGPSNKYEDAAELYEKAGNMFKLAQQCKK